MNQPDVCPMHRSRRRNRLPPPLAVVQVVLVQPAGSADALAAAAAVTRQRPPFQTSATRHSGPRQAFKLAADAAGTQAPLHYRAGVTEMQTTLGNGCAARMRVGGGRGCCGRLLACERGSPISGVSDAGAFRAQRSTTDALQQEHSQQWGGGWRAIESSCY